MPFEPEDELGGNYTQSKDSKALGGLDIVAFGLKGQPGPILDDQIVLVYPGETPYVGMLGLSPRPTNLTLNNPIKSPLETLVHDKIVPSHYFAYTAGAYYRDSPFASLTFGGYDAGRGNVDNVLTVLMNEAENRDLEVTIAGIDISGGHGSALNTPTKAFIDSVVAELWLPLETCQVFESAFGLVWNDVYDMYLISEAQHARLTSQNSSVTFTLGDDSAESTQIVLPYSAFDQVASYPLAGIQDESAVYYFPLKRAYDESQYYLGRTFLQEA